MFPLDKFDKIIDASKSFRLLKEMHNLLKLKNNGNTSL